MGWVCLCRRWNGFPLRQSITGQRCFSRSAIATTEELTDLMQSNPHNNISTTIASKVGTNLHLKRHHPLHIIKTMIQSYFKTEQQDSNFECLDNLSPVVTTAQCFDDLLTPSDHVSRAPTDTYYVDEHTLLRPHTTAHDSTLLRNQMKSFLVSGDVYRRDEIDASHYPVFHQMDGVRMFPEWNNTMTERSIKVEWARDHLKQTLEGMVRHVFGDVETRWVDAYFPFTEPSLELEIYFRGEWLEVLGCGILQQQIIRNAHLGEEIGWAFGLGLERLAMVLFDIPDIRLFWSQDPRFLNQFQDGQITKFEPFSKYPPCYKDVSFWHDPLTFHENHLCEMFIFHDFLFPG